MGTINLLSKEKADIIASLGYSYIEHKINDKQIIYSFIDTPKIRKLISSYFANNEFYVSKTVFM